MVVRRFPFSIGRALDNDLPLEDAGIWDRHLALKFEPYNGFKLELEPNAVATINNQKPETTRLHNGDVIAIGSVKFQFWLAAPRQRGLRFREGFVWTLIAFVTAMQAALIYWLVQY